MIIPYQELEEIENRATGTFVLKCPKAKVQLVTRKNMPNDITLVQFDSLGNTKTNQVFTGEMGFWNATKEFEKIVADKLGLREVAGFEIGMVVSLDRDYGKFKKGSVLLITAVNSENQATEYRLLNKKQIDNIKKSPAYSKLNKTDDSELLNDLGFKNVSDIDLNGEYEFQVMESEIVLPNLSTLLGFNVETLYPLNKKKGGGLFNIQGFSFDKNKKGKYVISGFGNFDDGAIGRVPLKDLKKS
jgi:hypothetical protein